MRIKEKQKLLFQMGLKNTNQNAWRKRMLYLEWRNKMHEEIEDKEIAKNLRFRVKVKGGM